MNQLHNPWKYNRCDKCVELYKNTSLRLFNINGDIMAYCLACAFDEGYGKYV